MTSAALLGPPLFLLAVVATGLPATAQRAGTELHNPRFEKGSNGENPRHWSVIGSGVKGTLTDKDPKEGKLCLRMRAPGFGNVVQTLDASAYRGKHVRLRAAVRARGRAQLWLRVDRPDGKRGFFDNMGDRPITSRDWDTYEITGKVADDAKFLAVGMMLIGGGSAWLDDVTVEVVDAKDLPKLEGPRAFDGRGLDNVTAFVRLLGYVRYFHPSEEAQAVDWDSFAIDGLRRVEAAASAEDLAKRLQEAFAPVAPTLRVVAGKKPPELPRELREQPKGARLRAWQHNGIGHNPQTSSIYRSRLVRRRELPDHPKPNEPWITQLPGGVTCMVPLTLWTKGTRKSAKKPKPRPVDVADRAVRLTAVAKAWNVFQHFYPYFDVVKTDWQAALNEALSAAAIAKDAEELLPVLRRMVAHLKDGHGYVSHMSDGGKGLLPLRFGFVQGKLVVMAVDATNVPEDAMLTAGMIVHSLGGKPAAKALSEQEALCSSATDWFRRYRAVQMLHRGPFGRDVTLEVEGPDGKKASVVLRYGRFNRTFTEKRPTKISELRKGIWYVDIGRINDSDLRKARDDLAKAKGIIYDFRGYPGQISNQTGLFGHLLKEKAQSPQWLVPEVRYPDRHKIHYAKTGRWQLPPRKPYFEARRAFLIDARAISYAESCMGIVEAYKLGEIVGPTPTAGTNGNVNPFGVPGGFQISWTGMRVLKHDGSHHHGVGVAPTVKVEPTLEGIRQGKDEVLEKAIQLLGGG